MRALAILVVLGSACVRSQTVPCGDRLCPAQTFCVLEPLTCVADGAKGYCNDQGITEGTSCSGIGFAGLCKAGDCLPGCGDGVIARDFEECDDGNFKSHDGCSSVCNVEAPSWQPMKRTWTGAFSHVAGFDESTSTLVTVTGVSDTGYRTQEWTSRSDGQAWIDTTSATMPSQRAGASMAYDSARHKLVLFGGMGGQQLGDTWEWTWDLATSKGGWIQRTDVGGPPARDNAAMVFDTQRSKIVLFGGASGPALLSDTWEYDGITWTQRSFGTKPAGRYGHMMGYDQTQHVTVLFGGSIDGEVKTNDTWTYDGTSWTQTSPSTVPAPRSSGSMAWLSGVGKVVLFGGLADVGAGSVDATNDTWTYDVASTTWAPLPSTLVPPARTRATLTPCSSGLVLFGGAQASGGAPFSDVWLLDSVNGWSNRSPRELPSARYGSPAVYDEAAHEIELVGGKVSESFPDPWSLVETTWYRRPEFTAPRRFFHAMGYDNKRKRVVLFGGYDANNVLYNDTYEYAGDNSFTWTQVTPAASPPKRRNAVMAFDGDVLVLFGGVDESGKKLDETWTYDGTTWTQESGPGPAATLQAAAAYHPIRDRLVLFDAKGETWAHHGHAWTKLADQIGAPPAREAAAMTFDWEIERLVMTGGAAQDNFTDVWEIDDVSWHRAPVSGVGPLPRVLFGLASSPRTRATVLVSGAGPGLVGTGDAWSYQYRSLTPDELCENGMDDDGDQLVDKQDPDCCDYVVPSTCTMD